ncbi:translocation/assembly module TamB [Prevotella sp. E13-17]|uniref:translocation/assembly module TamB domain-containing protein n=1 Tax=Prevotella sp. E13-17 TaxID=2913616 RepID=UPI001EDB382A|nr:translocation/assembly module TamB domain-containing protein [Prevotella sp. E13-17]UKK50637.1 translocation/assembly module TamB [Prevotella sp. E13-17]
MVQQVAHVASEQTGYDISVEHVDLDFPLDLGVDGVVVKSETADTLADIKRVVIDVRLLPLIVGNVVVDELSICEAKVNTLSLIPDIQVKGQIGRLQLEPSKIHLLAGKADLSTISLGDADVTILMSDTAAVDTTESEPLLWRIGIEKLTVRNTQATLHMPGDSMLVGGYIGEANLLDGDIDLGKEDYRIGHFEWKKGRAYYDLPYEPRQERGMDYNHIAASDINISIDSIAFKSPLTQLIVRQATLKEQSGLDITELRGAVSVSDANVKLASLLLRTPQSDISGNAYVDFSIADSVNPGKMHIDMMAHLAMKDMLVFAPDLDATMVRHWPAMPLTLTGRMDGNMKEAEIHELSAAIPMVFRMETNGKVANLMDTDKLMAQLDMRAETYNMGFLTPMFGLPANIRIPGGLSLNGDADINGPQYHANLFAQQWSGERSVTANLQFNRNTEAYQADIDIHRLDLHAFMPKDSLYDLSAMFFAKGQGLDFQNRKSWMDAEGEISKLQYGKLHLDSILLMGHLKNGHGQLEVNGRNRVIDGDICLDARIGQKEAISQLGVSTQLNLLDLYALGVMDEPLQIGLAGNFNVNSDLKQSHKLSGLFSDIYLRDSANTFHPENLGVLISAQPDTTYARLQNGNLIVKFDASGNYEKLIDKLTILGDTIMELNNRRAIDQQAIKRLLPTMRLYVTSGRENPLADILRVSQNIDFKDLAIDLSTSAERGVNGQAHLYGLNADSIRIDTIQVTLKDSDHGLTFQSRVANNRRNPQFVFTATADGLLQEHGLSLGVRFYDSKGDLGLRLGSKVEMESDGLRFTLMPSRPTIGYKEFALNKDNFLFLRNDFKLQAKVDLLADDGTGIKVYSESQDSTLLQDLTVSLHRINLAQLTAALPYVPRITGQLDGDYHLMMDQKRQISVASDMQVKEMTYEGSPMGTIATEFVYLQREDQTHAVEGTMMQNGREVATLKGNYRNKKETGGKEQLDADLSLMHAPLSLINGFIPDQLIGLEGFADGDISVNGSLDKLDMDGEVMLDSAYLISIPYGVRLRFDNDPVLIQDSKLLLENFTMYAYNDNPLNIQGVIDFGDMDNMSMNVRMKATNYQLINAKQTAKSLAFGKAFVNFFAVMRGPMNQLKMMGKLDVLGTTDLTYLLLDSPLSSDNQLDELVKFTDFSDSTQMVIERPAPEGMDMDLRISIDPGAHVKCGLNADMSNYVDLFGGGDLRMRYNNTESLTLNGRYTLTSGEMKYSLPVIPLKTFTIQDGSYVEFTGEAMNPTLNITATERNRASVGSDGQASRSVLFDCGVVITQTLNNMGLQFIINAPEDMSISSELQAMTPEQRGKLAVTMLTTGMYLADGNTSGFSMNSALSSFLESEINNITGNALKTIDLSVGLDNSTDATGQMHTDYSFKFAKRFWNNRLKVQIGGKVSSGNEAQQNGQNQSFFDNVTMEYRLTPTSNQYVKLFYNQNFYDWLEGYTGEYGGGYIWKRKLDSLWPRKEDSDTIKTPQPYEKKK